MAGKYFITFLVLSLFIAMPAVLADTLFEEQFSSKHPLLSSSSGSGGWMGDYFNAPQSQAINDDISTEIFSKENLDYYVKIKDNAALITTFSTDDFDTIELSYCRKTDGISMSNSKTLRVGWKLGSYDNPLGEWSKSENTDDNWANWNELEATQNNDLECVSFDLNGAEDQGEISIAFFLNGPDTLKGFVDEIMITGIAIAPPNGGGAGGGGGGAGGAPPEPEPEVLLCTENWVCGEWSTCVNGLQDRVCQDQNACGTLENLPEAVRACGTEESEAPAEGATTTTFPAATGVGILGAVIGPGGPTGFGWLLLAAMVVGIYFVVNTMRKASMTGKKGKK